MYPKPKDADGRTYAFTTDQATISYEIITLAKSLNLLKTG